MKTCPACQAMNVPESNFCAFCRAPFDRPSRGAYCPKGHAMHPSWPECLECKGERSQVQDFGSVPPRMPTVVEQGNPASPRGATVIESFVDPQAIAIPIPPPAPPPAPPSRMARGADSGQTVMDNPNATTPFGIPPAVTPVPAQTPAAASAASSVSRRVTQYVGAPGRPAAAPVATPPAPSASPVHTAAPERRSGRRIVGMLLTFTWRPEGQIFPVREGRNLIGRNPECDISIPEDPHLSDTNSHITYRRSFTIGDMVSMSGTDLNGTPVEDNFVRLPNYAQVRMGSTHFTFIAAEPPAPGNAP